MTRVKTRTCVPVVTSAEESRSNVTTEKYNLPFGSYPPDRPIVVATTSTESIGDDRVPAVTRVSLATESTLDSERIELYVRANFTGCGKKQIAFFAKFYTVRRLQVQFNPARNMFTASAISPPIL